MDKPRINNANWAMTRSYTDSYGEELWTVVPNEGNWLAVIHLQQNGKLYLSLMRDGRKSSSKSIINQEIVVDALQQLSQMVYEERGLRCIIGVSAREGNAKLFSTVRKAGFRRTPDKIRVRKKPSTIIFRYAPNLKYKETECVDCGTRTEEGDLEK